MLNQIFISSEDASTFPIHNGIYIHHLESDKFYTIEEGVGTFIWSQMDGSKNVGQILAETARLCRCDKENITDDVLEFIISLYEAGIIVAI